MTDWTKQISEFQRSWMEQQQKYLSDWLGALQQAGGARPPNVWEQAIAAMEKQVNDTLDMQKQGLLSIAGNMDKVEGAPDACTEWVHQLEEGVEMWADMQHRLWEVWFGMLRTMEPGAQSPGEKLFKDWQEMAEQAMSVQKEWLTEWTGTPRGTARGKSAKSSARKRAPAAAGENTGKTDS